MKKTDFLYELKNALMIEEGEIDETSPVQLTSLTTLAVIAFVDEYFKKQVKGSDLANIKSVSDLIMLIGPENID